MSCRDISSCTGSTVGFHHRCQTSVFLKNLCCPWDPEHWTHQNHAANQSTSKECTRSISQIDSNFPLPTIFLAWRTIDVCWRRLRDEPKTFVDEDCVTNQKNVRGYTSTYTVSSFSHNSRNSRLTFVLMPALSWFTRKTQKKKWEALSQAPEPLQRHKPLIPGSLGSYLAPMFKFSQIVSTDLATSNENAKRAERPGRDFRCSICRSANGQVGF